MRYVALCVILLFLLPVHISANTVIYEYRDPEGNIRFTDNLGNVPADQRQGATRIRGIRSAPGDRSDRPHEAGAGIQEDPGQEKNDTDLTEKRNSLLQVQKNLQEEYENIIEAKARLGDPPDRSAPRTEFEAYERGVTEINRRISDYQEQLQNYETRVKNYNARIDR